MKTLLTLLLLLSTVQAGTVPVKWEWHPGNDPAVPVHHTGFNIQVEGDSTIYTTPPDVRATILTVHNCQPALVTIQATGDAGSTTLGYVPIPPFEIWPDIQANSVTPTTTSLGYPTIIAIEGLNFQEGTKVTAGFEGTDIWERYKFNVEDEDCLTLIGSLEFLDGAQVGDVIPLTVETPDGQTALLNQAIEITVHITTIPEVKNVSADR